MVNFLLVLHCFVQYLDHYWSVVHLETHCYIFLLIYYSMFFSVLSCFIFRCGPSHSVGGRKRPEASVIVWKRQESSRVVWKRQESTGGVTEASRQVESRQEATVESINCISVLISLNLAFCVQRISVQGNTKNLWLGSTSSQYRWLCFRSSIPEVRHSKLYAVPHPFLTLTVTLT